MQLAFSPKTAESEPINASFSRRCPPAAISLEKTKSPRRVRDADCNLLIRRVLVLLLTLAESPVFPRRARFKQNTGIRAVKL